MKTFNAMNTQFLLAALPDKACEIAQAFLLDAAVRWSRFREDSELSFINRNKGQWIHVDELSFQLLQAAWEAFQATSGIFNPFLGEVMRRTGYNRTFSLLPQQDSAKQPAILRPQPGPRWDGPDGPRYLQFDNTAQRILLAPEAELDLGGIAKGWIAQYTAEYLMRNGLSSGLIDAGGDIILWGEEPEQKVWGIEVAHPYQSAEKIAELWLPQTAAIATSSMIKRSWSHSGVRVHHVIDPRTMLPAQSDFIQVTVLTRNLTHAEFLAKGLLLLGEAEGIEWLQQLCPDSAFIAVRLDGTIVCGNQLARYCSEWEVLPYVPTV
jgi:thiamine biosynthesis lipoprotein